MTDSSAPALTTDKRDALRARIEAAERRNAERTLADQAREAAQAASDYTRAHPLTVIGGALAVGLLVGLATRPGRRVAARAAGAVGAAASGAASSAASSVKGVAARGGSRIGALLGDAALAWSVQLIEELLESARTGQGNIGELAEEAAQKLSAAAATARDTARTTGSKATRAVRERVGKAKD